MEIPTVLTQDLQQRLMLPLNDASGKDRVAGQRIDMGAYELKAEAVIANK